MSRNCTSSTKDGLHLLQDIVSDSSRDVATQTGFNTKSARNKSDGDVHSKVSESEKLEDNLSSKESVPKLDLPKAGTKPTSRNLKAQNPLRLVIAPDSNGQKGCTGLRLSLEDPENGEINSFRLSLSLTSLSDDCNQIKAVRRPKSSGKFRKSKHLSPPNSWEENKNMSTGSTSSNGTDFATEHRLSRTENASVLAWLKLKNFEEKEQRKARRRERRELRKAAREDAEKKQKREEESEKRFAQWLHVKRREAKRAWQETRARSRVGCVETKNEIQNDDDPPANYTVVPTFKGVESLTESTQSSSTGEVGKTTAPKKTQSKQGKQKKLYKVQRPRTSDSPQNRPHLSPSEARPRTANGRLSANDNTKNNEGSRGITFEAWMARKRLQDKEKAKQRKREIVDEALEKGILKLARKRVENIRQGKKEIDTGIPKWRAKNRFKSVPDDDTTSHKQDEIFKQYALPPGSQKSHANLSRTHDNEKNSERLGRGDERSNSTGVMREIETIRKFCENVKLNSNGPEPIKEPHQSNNADREAKPASQLDNIEEKHMITTSDEASESRQNRSDTKAGREGEGQIDGDPKKKEEPPTEKSTVRENYFVYGKGVDPPSMKPAKWNPNQVW